MAAAALCTGALAARCKPSPWLTIPSLKGCSPAPPPVPTPRYGNGCVCPPSNYGTPQQSCPSGCANNGKPFINEGKCFCDDPVNTCPAGCVPAQ